MRARALLVLGCIACAGARAQRREPPGAPGTLAAVTAALAVRPAPDYREAERILLGLVGGGDDAAVAQRLALVYTRTGRPARAAEALAVVAGRDPLAAAGRVRALREAGNLGVAEEAVGEAVARWPAALALRWERAALRAERGDVAGAIEELREHLGAGHADAAGFALLARLYGRAGELGAASLALRRAVALDPKHAPARSALGVVLLVRGDLAGAAVELEAALRGDPDDLRARYGLGVLLFQEGLYAKALPRFAWAHGVWPGSVEAHLGLAETLVELGKLDDARRHAEALVAAHPQDARGWCTLGRIDALTSGAAARALSRYRKCQELWKGSLPEPAARSMAALETEVTLHR